MNNRKYPLKVYVVCPKFKRRGTSKLQKIVDTAIKGLPHVKTEDIIDDVDSPYTIKNPCIVIPYNKYIREIL